ncbi:MAG TPA: hypothetical protein EYQ83_12815 [Acidobacteria bacterium]|nr:hypothetical protein [Acidobacteriota bacterium]
MTLLRVISLVMILPALLAGCATTRLRLPDGPGAPFHDFLPRFETAVADCGQIQHLDALIRLRGRGGGVGLNTRVRVRVGLSAPGSARLEGLAPFGAPVFFLVARPGEATLLLTREKRVLRDVPFADMLEGLVGVSLNPDALRSVLTGCLVEQPRPTTARTIGEWIVVELEGEALAYLQRVNGAYRLTAGRRDGFEIYYDQFLGGLPREVRVISESGGDPDSAPVTDLTVSLSQVDTNVAPLDAAFSIDIPPDVLPMTLRELRGGAGPLDAPPDPPASSDTR